MATSNLLSVNNVYMCGEKCKISNIAVSYDPLKAYSFTLRNLERELDEEVRSDFWRPIGGFLRRFRFEACSCPLPFNELPCLNRNPKFDGEKVKRQVNLVYPSIFSSVLNLVDYAELLYIDDSNPMLDSILRILRNSPGKKTGLLLKDPHLIPSVETYFKKVGINSVVFVDVYQLRQACCFDQLIVIGSPYWYREYNYVFSAPRSSNIFVIHYNWLPGKWRSQQVFLGSRGVKIDHEDTPDQETGRINPHRLLTNEDFFHPIKPNWGNIRAKAGVDNHHEEIEQSEARLLLLEEGNAVFVDSSESSRLLVIDINVHDEELAEDSDETSSRVMRLPLGKIEPGMFILLRTGGGGDYIVPVADKLMGKEARLLREKLAKWKTLLREETSKRGTEQTVIKLKELGSEIASPTNIRNWMSDRSIKPRDYNEFLTITKMTGLAGETEDLWNSAEFIDKAHRKAGFVIRQILLEQLLETDLSLLFRKGRVDFEIEKGSGASLTAFRIHAISPDIYQVPVYHLNRVFEGADDQWPE